MDNNAKKTALRMIPYGLYILTARANQDKISAASVTWVTQASFDPPLVLVCVRMDSFIHEVMKDAGAFALNILGKQQGELASTFFKPAVHEDDKLSGAPYWTGKTGSPILQDCPAYIDCRVVGTVAEGDHTVFLGQVVDAGVRMEITGRPDEQTLWVRDLGDKIFYGG